MQPHGELWGGGARELLRVMRSVDTGGVKQMLKIQIDNSELEENIKQQRIRQDIGVSIQQLDAGEGLPLAQVMEGVRSKYE